MEFGFVKRLLAKIALGVAHRQFVFGEEVWQKLYGALTSILLGLQGRTNTLHFSRRHTTA